MAILKQWNGSDWVNVVSSGVVAVDDIPVNSSTTTPVSSNWAYDHAALTTAHGISSFGATLVDDTTALASRTTLELADAYFMAAIQTGALM